MLEYRSCHLVLLTTRTGTRYVVEQAVRCSTGTRYEVKQAVRCNIELQFMSLGIVND